MVLISSRSEVDTDAVRLQSPGEQCQVMAVCFPKWPKINPWNKIMLKAHREGGKVVPWLAYLANNWSTN